MATAWPCSSSRDTLRARLRVVFSRVPSARRAIEVLFLFPDVFNVCLSVFILARMMILVSSR